MIALVVLALLALGAAGLPGLWVKRVMARHHEPRRRYDITGAELARELIRRLELSGVRVEATEGGDHYDPRERVVRLSPAVHDRGSLTAVTVAAHEVGHAVQDAIGYRPLRLRTRLVTWAALAQRLGAGLLLGLPVIALVLRAPALVVPLGVLGFCGVASGVVVHLLTLPTEFDASYRRALPLLEAGYLHREDRPHARRILRAAALTYVAAAAMSLINVWMWLRLLRP